MIGINIECNIGLNHIHKYTVVAVKQHSMESECSVALSNIRLVEV